MEDIIPPELWTTLILVDNKTDTLLKPLTECQSYASWILFLRHLYRQLYIPNGVYHPNHWSGPTLRSHFNQSKQTHLKGVSKELKGEGALSHIKILEALSLGFSLAPGKDNFSKSTLQAIGNANFWVSLLQTGL